MDFLCHCFVDALCECVLCKLTYFAFGILVSCKLTAFIVLFIFVFKGCHRFSWFSWPQWTGWTCWSSRTNGTRWTTRATWSSWPELCWFCKYYSIILCASLSFRNPQNIVFSVCAQDDMEGSGIHFSSVPGIRGPVGIQVDFSLLYLYLPFWIFRIYWIFWIFFFSFTAILLHFRDLPVFQDHK